MKAFERRKWVNWGLITAASLSVGVVVSTRDMWTTAERSVRADHLVVGFRDEEIQRIQITAGDTQVVIERGSLERRDDAEPSELEANTGEVDPRWLLVEPHQGEAEDAAVDGLLRTIGHAPFIRKVEDQGFDRKKAGLDAPEGSIELTTANTRTRVHIGAAAPAPAKSRYVEIGGEGTANQGVYVVSETTAKELLVSPDTFRVKQVVPYGAGHLERVTLTKTNTSPLTIVNAGAGWRLETTSGAPRLDPDAVQRLFAAFARSRAELFVDGDVRVSGVPPSGAAGEVVEVRFVPKAKTREPLTVRFGGVCPASPSLELAVTASEPPLRVCTPALHLDTFVERLPELVDRNLLSVTTPDAVEEIRVRGEAGLLELARRGDVWTMRQPSVGEVEREVGDAFVSDLLSIRGELVDKPTGELKPLGEVTVFQAHAREGSDPAETVEIFTLGTDNQALWVHRRDDQEWLMVSGKHRRLFSTSALLLASVQLLSLDLERLGAVTVTTADWVQRFQYEGRQVGCKVLAPGGYQADSALCLDVLDELRLLRARRWIAAQDDGSFGFDAPTASVAFETLPPSAAPTDAVGGASADGNERILVIGARTADGDYFARLSPNPAVFTLKQSVVETLSGLVVDRSPFIIDAQQVESLSVRRGGPRARVFSLRRLGNDLVAPRSTDGEEPALGERSAVELLDALTMLRPEAAVALLPRGTPEAAPSSFGFGSPTLDVSVTLGRDDERQVLRWVVGQSDVYRDASIYYAMVVTAGPSAVFALPREAVQRIMAAL